MSGGVSVEIFAAGDGINYPKDGHTVTIHYTVNLRDQNINNQENYDCILMKKITNIGLSSRWNEV
jgi:hypothetical protein